MMCFVHNDTDVLLCGCNCVPYEFRWVIKKSPFKPSSKSPSIKHCNNVKKKKKTGQDNPRRNVRTCKVCKGKDKSANLCAYVSVRSAIIPAPPSIHKNTVKTDVNSLQLASVPSAITGPRVRPGLTGQVKVIGLVDCLLSFCISGCIATHKEAPSSQHRSNTRPNLSPFTSRTIRSTIARSYIKLLF